MSELLTIGEVSAATGLAPSALRFYEREGLIRSSGRVGGKRVYDAVVIKHAAFVELCQQARFTIAEIAAILRDDTGNSLKRLAKEKLVEVDRHIADAESARTMLNHILGCPDPVLGGCATFERSIAKRAMTLAERRTGSRASSLRPKS